MGTPSPEETDWIEWRRSFLANIKRAEEAGDRRIQGLIDNLRPGMERAQAVYRELQKQTDRGAGIIGGALVEAELPRFIIAHLANSTKGTRGLFDHGRPLEAFGTQITVAYALGLVSNDVGHDLDRIREMRNKFAHSLWYVEKGEKQKGHARDVVTFEHERIKAWALSLKYPEMLGILLEDVKKRFPSAVKPESREFISALSPRARYEMTCQCLHLMLVTGQHIDSPVPLRYQTSALPS